MMTRLENKAKKLFARLSSIENKTPYKLIILKNEEQVWLCVEGFEDLELGIY